MNLKYLLSSAILGSCASLSFGQFGWADECHDHSAQPPWPSQYSDPYGINNIGNDLIGVSIGVVGTSTWGGPEVCWLPQRTLAAPGRLAFMSGPIGSVQTDFDNDMALTMGAPFDPVGDFCFANITKDDENNSVLFGNGGGYLVFTGASKRYTVFRWADAEVDVGLVLRTLGDAVILAWEITNLQATARPLGLQFAAWTALHTSGFQSDPETGATHFFSVFGTNFGIAKWTSDFRSGHFVTPTTKPIRNDHRLARTSTRFPTHVDALAGQTANYGLRLYNIPDLSMKKLSPDPLDSRNFIGASTADLIRIGDHFWTAFDNNIRFNVFGDFTGTKEEADVIIADHTVAQRYPVANVAAGQSRTIIQLIKTNWGVSDYNDPYAFVVDAPKLINADPTGQDGLRPNPMTVRAYVDNQYAKFDQTINMQSVRFVISLPTDGSLALAPGQTAEKTIPGVNANEIGSVDWELVSDGVTFGDIPIKITAFPFPGPKKELTTTIHIAATPKIRLSEGAQLITIPYTFPDNSLGAVLGLTPEVDFRAFRWDNGQKAYVQATTATRGEGYWIVPLNDQGFVTLQNATIPADRSQGGLIYNLHKGWNLIGNPYNYPVPLSDLVAVVEDAPQDTFTWTELVTNGFVSSALATWQRNELAGPFSGKYVFTTGQSSYLAPHKGYWIFLTTFRDIQLSWPGVFYPGMTGSGRGSGEEWKQTDKQWRLQIAARNGLSSDTENYLAYTNDTTAVSKLTLPKPPTAIDMSIEVVIEGMIDGQLSRIAQAVTDKKTKTEFKVHVNSQAGDVTLTWPNLPSIPRNIKAKLTDVATGEVRDLRSVSGYNYFMTEAGSREFVVSLEQGGAARPVIGNVVVSGSSRVANAPMTINYALSANALVTIRVLSGSGKEVFTVTRGRADNAGENQVTWNLQDNANRAVAPGVYRIEILAETPGGERVRKIVPINVVR